MSVFSLPTQRCFHRRPNPHQDLRLFSAYAEVFPHRRFGVNRSPAFLCLRRGVSMAIPLKANPALFSLPTQRCFRRPFHSCGCAGLFSAYAEVFLASLPIDAAGFAFLCLRRGVSVSCAGASSRLGFSLPTQRCFPEGFRRVPGYFLFSAYAEVFPGEVKIR